MTAKNQDAPWYKRTCRWGQTNLTEIDPIRYDRRWWRKHWENTSVQGIIVNAGGIIAYYPSGYKVYKAEFLGNRDLLGEIIDDARSGGLTVLARMDINRIGKEASDEHPEWVCRKKNREPYQAGDRFITCINGSYYSEFIPGILRELIEKYHPDGFADNSWSGLTRRNICYCERCAEKYKAATGNDLPVKADWEDPAYRTWIRWNYDIRVELYDHYNKITRELGGENCLWLGMTRGEVIDQCEGFRDFYRLSKKARIILLDSQRREQEGGFQSNAEMGKLLHEVAGWDILIPESMAMYQAAYKGQPTFRHCSKPEPEARMWMIEGFAGGIQPWWHHVGALSDDRRQYAHAKNIFDWHEKNQKYLVDRKPIAQVALVWSQDNFDFYGRDDLEEKVMLPWRGFREALIRGGIPYRVVHIDDLKNMQDQVETIVLPNLACMSARQLQNTVQFAESGGNIIATGETGLYDENGNQRSEFGLAELFGISYENKHSGSRNPDSGNWDNWEHHSYLRISPPSAGRHYGPESVYPVASGGPSGRLPLFSGFEATDIIPFGGRIEHVKPNGSEALLTLVPPFPVYPPETSWMREPDSGIPGLLYREHHSGGKMVYFPADIDRNFGRFNLPDHGNLLSNCIDWTLGGKRNFRVEAKGVVDCHLFRQDEKIILHLVNLSGEGFRKPPLHRIVPVGKVSVELKKSLLGSVAKVRSLVKNSDKIPFRHKGDFIQIDLDEISDHEVLLIEP